MALGFGACAGRSEPPPDPADGAEQPADPGPKPEPPVDSDPGSETPRDQDIGSEQTEDPIDRPPRRIPDEPKCMSNADVRALVASGEADAAIIARLTTSETCFDISSAAMLDLINAGVSPRLIQAMTAAARREER
ncbi:MAG: hypothetical protein F4Z65_08090 [Acidobacteria bacterium]|nr:hypothetical protein [Acidobacteriota bacterium]